ncbi:MAG: bifunctional dihydroneopterin aldolase/7,8-dihydroneopterin epimerase [Anaerolineales bacterium]
MTTRKLTDKIIIEDLRVHGILGIYPQERQTPQEICINIVVYTDISRAAQTDDIADCVDYAALAEQVKTHVENTARFTVEALAEDIAALCLQSNKRVKQVRVRVEKPEAVPEAASVGVEITRRKGRGKV